MNEIIKSKYKTRVMIYLSMGVIDFDTLKLGKKNVNNPVNGDFLSMKYTFWVNFNFFVLKT